MPKLGEEKTVDGKILKWLGGEWREVTRKSKAKTGKSLPVKIVIGTGSDAITIEGTASEKEFEKAGWGFHLNCLKGNGSGFWGNGNIFVE